MGSISDRATGDGFGGAGVDAEFVIDDRAVDAGGCEGVPVCLDGMGKFSAVFGK